MTPFAYPKSLHKRTQTPPEYSSYRRYKPFLREEFERKCVYCRMPDTVRGQDGFGVDHYRPKKLFPDLRTAYSNLFYCCNACNSRKGSYWPIGKDKQKSAFLPNPCDHEMFRHVRFHGSEVDGRSDAGRFTVEILDLNDPEVVALRGVINTAISTCVEKRREFELLADQIRRARTKGSVAVADANLDLARVAENIAELDNQLLVLRGGT